MRRLIRTAALLAATAALAAPSGALAFSNGGGSSGSAPGQAIATSHCTAAFLKQDAAGLTAGGGPKAIATGPLNCDHYWQDIGVIGGGS